MTPPVAMASSSGWAWKVTSVWGTGRCSRVRAAAGAGHKCETGAIVPFSNLTGGSEMRGRALAMLMVIGLVGAAACGNEESGGGGEGSGRPGVTDDEIRDRK